MRNQAIVAALTLLLAACSGKPEPAASAPAPDASAAGDAAADLGPPPPADVSTPVTAPDAELEAAIRATAPDYRADSVVGEGDGGKARYAAARVDMNGDGNNEVFVYLMGPYFCGTGGCNLLLFSQGVDGYSLLASIPTSEALVIRAATQNSGYSDFWRMQSGGGQPPAFVRHQYQDGHYVEVARASADTMPTGPVVMDEATDFANGLVLEPRKD